MARTLRTLIAAPAVVVLMMAGFASPSDARCSVDEAPPRCEIIAEKPIGAGAAIVAPSGEAMPGQSPAGIPGLGSGGLDLLPFVVAGLVLASVCALVLIVVARRRRSPVPQAAAAGMGDEDGMEAVDALLSMAASSPPGDDSHIPRWRRPSVAAARFETDNSNAVRAATAATIPPARPRLAFAQTDARAERMLVRYDNVPLLEQPDEAFGRILEELLSGDEVEIIERDSLWAHVRAPTGVTGWTPVMTVTAMIDAIFEEVPAAVAFVEPEVSPPDEEPVPLEVLLEAIAAERRAIQESANDAHPESLVGTEPESGTEPEAAAVPTLGTEAVEPVKKNKAPATPRRPRTTRPRSDTPVTRKR